MYPSVEWDFFIPVAGDPLIVTSAPLYNQLITGSGRPRKPHLIDTLSPRFIWITESGRWTTFGGSTKKTNILQI